MTGQYENSLTMNNQQGLGLRISGENNQKWGFTTGLQSTRIGMTPVTQVSAQNQDNWLIAGYVHQPSTMLPGRWTFQIDAHQVHNDASQNNTSNVRAIAPQVTWLSYTQPLKIDLSYANSNYKNTPAVIHQISSAVAYGFNESSDWVQIRKYEISNLTTTEALGHSSTSATDFKLTHFLKVQNKWSPMYITLGLERGKRIYSVDMASQTVYNLPMLNEGGENIAASWKLSSKTDLHLQFNRTRYFAKPTPLPEHRFTLSTFSAQIATAW